MRRVTLDYETVSEVDVSEVGAYAYAQHPSTDILCMSYSIDGGEPATWMPGMPLCEDFLFLLTRRPLLEAHNAGFERQVWQHVGRQRYDFPPIWPEQWRCTMAACAYKALPLKLERAAEALRLRQRKDMAGHKAMQKLSSGHVYKDQGVHFQRMMEVADYCAQDVRTEVELSQRVGDLPPESLRAWQLDQKINDRGVRIDLELCEAAVAIGKTIDDRLSEEFAGITGGLEPTQRDKVLAWLQGKGFEGLTNLQAATVDEWLEIMPSGTPRRALEIRKEISKSSAKKYAAALACVCPDGRARGLLQWHGATTGRRAGRLIQPQNFPKPSNPKLHMEDLVHAIKRGDPDFLEVLFGSPMLALADATRGMIIPDPGNILGVYDFSSIETVILMALAGETEAVALMEKGQKLYIPMAEKIFGRKIDKDVDLKEYTAGKAAVLGCGYGMGWSKFRDDVKQKHAMDIGDELAQQTVTTYRQGYSRVPQLWKGLEAAALNTVVLGGAHEYRGIVYEMAGEWLTCRLPSGRLIHYFEPEVRDREMPWVDDDGDPVIKPQLKYRAYKEGRLQDVWAYGGHLTENVVQAIAGDFLDAAMVRCEDAGYPVILTVHDELVVEFNPSLTFTAHREQLKEIMTERPEWAKAYPVGAEGGLLTRYSK